MVHKCTWGTWGRDESPLFSRLFHRCQAQRYPTSTLAHTHTQFLVVCVCVCRLWIDRNFQLQLCSVDVGRGTRQEKPIVVYYAQIPAPSFCFFLAHKSQRTRNNNQIFHLKSIPSSQEINAITILLKLGSSTREIIYSQLEKYSISKRIKKILQKKMAGNKC